MDEVLKYTPMVHLMMESGISEHVMDLVSIQPRIPNIVVIQNRKYSSKLTQMQHL
jgi:hypothetical protein